jgi:hypothetical protein
MLVVIENDVTGISRRVYCLRNTHPMACSRYRPWRRFGVYCFLSGIRDRIPEFVTLELVYTNNKMLSTVVDTCQTF